MVECWPSCTRPWLAPPPLDRGSRGAGRGEGELIWTRSYVQGYGTQAWIQRREFLSKKNSKCGLSEGMGTGRDERKQTEPRRTLWPKEGFIVVFKMALKAKLRSSWPQVVFSKLLHDLKCSSSMVQPYK